MRGVELKQQLKEFSKTFKGFERSREEIDGLMKQEEIGIIGCDDIFKAYIQLNKFPFLQEKIQEAFPWIEKMKSSTSDLDSEITLAPSEVLSFVDASINVQSILKKYIDFLDELFPDDDPTDQLNIKLPDEISLADLSKVVDDLDYILNDCRIVSEKNGQRPAILHRVDSGSMWLILGMTSGAVGLVGSMCTVALRICRQVLDLRKAMLQFRVLKLGTEVIETLKQAIDQSVRELAYEEAKTILEDSGAGQKDGNETLNSTVSGIEKLVNLLFRGVALVAPLAAPEAVAATFPAPEEIAKLAAEALKPPAQLDR